MLSTASSLCISPGMCAVKKLEPAITVGCLTDREQRSLLFRGDHEQGYFALRCVSMDYKKLMFAVRRSAMRPGVVLRILHSACGSVYADKQRLHSRMTKGGLRSGQSRTRIDRVGPAPGMTEQDLSEGLWQRVLSRKSRSRQTSGFCFDLPFRVVGAEGVEPPTLCL